MRPPPLPPRRSSMQDASNDIMRATYPPALALPPDPPIVREQSPRFFSPPRQRREKGKGRALGIYVPAPPAGDVVGRCRWNASFGYVCELCGRIVPNPSLHDANADGGGCIDFNDSHLPYLRDVEADVARDPERAIAEANAVRASQQMQQGQQWVMPAQSSRQGFGGMAAAQSWSGAQPSSAGFGWPEGSTSRPSFTTASQIQQWAGESGQPHASSSGWQQKPAPQQYAPGTSSWQHGQEQQPGNMEYGGGPGMFF